MHEKDNDVKSRISLLPDDDPLVITSPDCDLFLKNCWHELGLTSKVGMGEDRISWQELDAYCRRKRINLTPFECDCLMNMSNEYMRYKNLSTEFRSIKSPHNPGVTKQDLINRFESFEKKTNQEG